MQIYIAGIHTNVGKTQVSGAICALFGYDYFKLLQAGNPQDRSEVHNIVSNCSSFDIEILQNLESSRDSKSSKIRIFNNGITLKTPASPHIAKLLENKKYNGYDIKIPDSKNLVIELAGGLFSPLDSNICMIDYIRKFKRDVLLVGGYYLGSINHILLSINALKEIKILKLIMFGDKNYQIDNFIKKYSNIEIAHLPYFNKENFEVKTKDFKKNLESIFCYN